MQLFWWVYNPDQNVFLGKDDPEAAAKDDSTSVVTSETGRKRGEEEPQGLGHQE